MDLILHLYQLGVFMSIPSPLESLAAFAIAFVAGVISSIVFGLYAQTVKANTP